MGAFIDLTGQTFGRLTVLPGALSIHGKVHWRCRCRCGQATTITAHNLRSGTTRSCGCLQRETAAAVQSRNNRRRWARRCANLPYPPAAISNYQYDATLSPSALRGWAREMARLAANDARVATDERDALAAFRWVAKCYPHMAPVLDALPREQTEQVA